MQQLVAGVAQYHVWKNHPQPSLQSQISLTWTMAFFQMWHRSTSDAWEAKWGGIVIGITYSAVQETSLKEKMSTLLLKSTALNYVCQKHGSEGKLRVWCGSDMEAQKRIPADKRESFNTWGSNWPLMAEADLWWVVSSTISKTVCWRAESVKLYTKWEVYIFFVTTFKHKGIHLKETSGRCRTASQPKDMFLQPDSLMSLCWYNSLQEQSSHDFFWKSLLVKSYTDSVFQQQDSANTVKCRNQLI